MAKSETLKNTYIFVWDPLGSEPEGATLFFSAKTGKPELMSDRHMYFICIHKCVCASCMYLYVLDVYIHEF